jgi:hypothetical protein
MTSTDADTLRFTDDVQVVGASRYVEWYREHVRRGPTYYRHADTGLSDDFVSVHDLGWAVLLEGRPSSAAAQALVLKGEIDISSIPRSALETLDDDQCELVVDGIMMLVALEGFRSSLASKVLHPKRPGTIPILDNRAIFGSFLRDGWAPRDPISASTVSGRRQIRTALLAVRRCLLLPENQEAWSDLGRTFATNRLELFDMIWWAVTRAGSDQTFDNGVARLAHSDPPRVRRHG